MQMFFVSLSFGVNNVPLNLFSLLIGEIDQLNSILSRKFVEEFISDVIPLKNCAKERLHSFYVASPGKIQRNSSMAALHTNNVNKSTKRKSPDKFICTCHFN